ncbi:Protein of unknown function [Pyronema omphalodes CBS 100304]|uniref:Uncharacterized protein n=1 Tax=Pyronema omphalodes (strain CBS 100304) TaxID=1076935 RepID=U4LTT9_PYROM|nr:Protein of unknown function [Pyronema omphalodes CBS 100304]
MAFRKEGAEERKGENNICLEMCRLRKEKKDESTKPRSHKKQKDASRLLRVSDDNSEIYKEPRVKWLEEEKKRGEKRNKGLKEKTKNTVSSKASTTFQVRSEQEGSQVALFTLKCFK